MSLHADAFDNPLFEGSPEIRAGYKIELMFGPNRTLKGDNIALIHGWVSGRYLNGEGDEKLLFCLDASQAKDNMSYKMLYNSLFKDEKKNYGCGSLVEVDRPGGKIYCKKCNVLREAARMIDILPFNGSNLELANVLTVLFRSLDNNADIYCKYAPTDIRYVAMEKASGLNVARRLRGLSIYPLKNILKDVSAGADLTQKFKDYLSA